MSILVLFVGFFSVVVAHPGGHCDHAPIKEFARSSNDYVASLSSLRHGRRLSTFEGLRIALDFDDLMSDPAMTQEKADFLQDVLMPHAQKWFEGALKVNPIITNLKLASCFDSYCTTCGSGETSVTIPESYKESNTGVANADYILFVTARNTQRCQQTHLLASAGWCQLDQDDRPIAGTVNFCPGRLAVPTNDRDFVNTFILSLHELSHALGFSSSSFPYMRDKNGDPRTPRQANGNPESQYYRQIQVPGCTSGTELFPDENTVLITDDLSRNLTCPDYNDPSLCKIMLVTPKVVEVGRWWFDCPNLQGVEIENQPTSSCSFVGSHWEQRLFASDFLASTLIPGTYDTHISPLTLAFFEDTGWYEVDYSYTNCSMYGRTWGYKQGCSFVSEKCESVQGDSFCFDPNTRTCAFGSRSKGVCSISTSMNVPAQFQYFDSTSTGGQISQMDFCPIVRAGTDCRVTPDSYTSYQGETFSDSGYCLASTMSETIDGQRLTDPSHACYDVQCIGGVEQSDAAVRITLDPHEGSTVTFDCGPGSAGEARTIPDTGSGISGTVTCPDPYFICGFGDGYDGLCAARVPSPTPSSTPSVSPSPVSPSPSPSPVSPSPTPTGTPSSSVTPSITPSISVTPSSSPIPNQVVTTVVQLENVAADAAYSQGMLTELGEKFKTDLLASLVDANPSFEFSSDTTVNIRKDDSVTSHLAFIVTLTFRGFEAEGQAAFSALKDAESSSSELTTVNAYLQAEFGLSTSPKYTSSSRSSQPASSTPEEDDGFLEWISDKWWILAAAGGGIVLLVIIACCCCCCRNRRPKMEGPPVSRPPPSSAQYSVGEYEGRTRRGPSAPPAPGVHVQGLPSFPAFLHV